MNRPPAVPRLAPTALAVALAGIAGCGVGAQSPEDRAKACTSIAQVVRPAGLDGAPDEPTATKVADAMDPLLSSLRDVAAHDAAVRLHQQLHRYASAVKNSSDKADEALSSTRDAARDLARACDLPADDLLNETAATPGPSPS